MQALIENMVIPSEYVLYIMPKGTLTNGGQFLYTTTSLRIIIDTSPDESTIVLVANTTLPAKRLWDVFVLAYGCKENPLTDGLELSM